jgi:trehalose synthase
MLKLIHLKQTLTLDDYASVAQLANVVQDLRAQAQSLLPVFKGRSILMVNSTEQGGGVAEMMPPVVLILAELGFNIQWAVMGAVPPEFFSLTKRIHNLIHGEGDSTLNEADRKLYEEVSATMAAELKMHLKPGDFLIVHDPQPLGAGAVVRRAVNIHAVWRCHIGFDEVLDSTRAAWEFLKPYANIYDRSIFSAPEYVPDYLTGKSSIMHPGIDPLSHKNRHLPPYKLTGILCNSGLAIEHAPVLTPPFAQRAQRIQPDGRFGVATQPDEIGFLYRPIIAQLSRWDRLKGFKPLLAAFVHLKQKLKDDETTMPARQRRQLEILRLVLAGPAPGSIQDDPEAVVVLRDLQETYCNLESELQRDIVLLSLPMESRKNNELMVNAIQRCACIVVQNSIREGFGLTATEAMWKGTPVLATQACGLRQQIRNGIDGRLVRDPEDPQEIADKLNEMLADDHARERWARNAQKRVFMEFLVLTQIQQWLRVLQELGGKIL